MTLDGDVHERKFDDACTCMYICKWKYTQVPLVSWLACWPYMQAVTAQIQNHNGAHGSSDHA